MPEVRHDAQIESCGVWDYFLRGFFFLVGFKELADIANFNESPFDCGVMSSGDHRIHDQPLNVPSSGPNPAPKTFGAEDLIRDDVLFGAFALRPDIDILINYPVPDNEHLVAGDAVQ
jgi:hypothetical protein